MLCALHDDLARSPIDSLNGQYMTAHLPEWSNLCRPSLPTCQESSLDPISYADSKIRLEKPSCACASQVGS